MKARKGAALETRKKYESVDMSRLSKRMSTNDSPCTKTGHDDGLRVERGQLHDTWLDGNSDLGANGKTSQVPRALSVPGCSTRRSPINRNNQELDRISNGSVGRSDGIMTRLDFGYQSYKFLDRWTGRLELFQDIRKRDRLDF